MRRYISGLLALSLALSLTACGGGQAASTAAPSAPVESAPAAALPSAVPALPVATEAPTPAATPAAAEPTTTETPAVETQSVPPEPTPTETASAETEAPPEDEETGVPMPEFTTVDLKGNAVTKDIFSQADLTVVNAWATYCPPCINEMPELGKWASEMPDNLQLIGLVCDLYVEGMEDTRELAATILDKAGADFPCLAVSDDLVPLLYSISVVPTTFFVDRRGNIVGNAVFGARVDQYKAAVEELLP